MTWDSLLICVFIWRIFCATHDAPAATLHLMLHPKSPKIPNTHTSSLFSFFLFFAEQFHIFVGDLSSEIETQQLREAFTPFGEIS